MFILFKAREVDVNEDICSCPIVLVHRDGNLVTNIVLVSYESGEDFDTIEIKGS